MTTRKTRSDIEAEIAALQAALAATQPDDVEFESASGRVEFRFSADGAFTVSDDGRMKIYGLFHIGDGGERSNLTPLRDWLNYHFPPEAA